MNDLTWRTDAEWLIVYGAPRCCSYGCHYHNGNGDLPDQVIGDPDGNPPTRTGIFNANDLTDHTDAEWLSDYGAPGAPHARNLLAALLIAGTSFGDPGPTSSFPRSGILSNNISVSLSLDTADFTNVGALRH